MEDLNITGIESFHHFTPKEEEADLWKSVLMEHLRQGNTATTAITAANQCVKALREQFPS